MYTLHFELAEDDYLRFYLYHHFNYPSSQKRASAQPHLFVAIYGVLLALLFLFVFHMPPAAAWLIPMACISLFSLAEAPWLVRWRIRNRIERIRANNEFAFQTTADVTFGNDEIRSVFDGTEEKTEYSTIQEIIIGRDDFYIYRSPTSVFIIPFRAFAADQELQDFLLFIEAKTHITAVQGRAR